MDKLIENKLLKEIKKIVKDYEDGKLSLSGFSFNINLLVKELEFEANKYYQSEQCNFTESYCKNYNIRKCNEHNLKENK